MQLWLSTYKGVTLPWFFLAAVLLLIVLLMQTALMLPFALKSTHASIPSVLCNAFALFYLLFVSIFMCFALQKALVVKLLVTNTLSLKVDLSCNVAARELRF